MIPNKLKRQTVAGAAFGASAEAAVGAEDQDQDMEEAIESCSDSDVDADVHDFTSDGQLPETLTSLHVVKTAQERAAQLAADCHQVRSTVGMADIESRYPKDLHFLHQPDESGERSATEAMLLLPTKDAEGIKMSSFSESVALRNGTYQEVPVPTEWINVSDKMAKQAKRNMAENGMMDLSTRAAVGAAGVRYAANKITRAQLGCGLHDVWIRDFIKSCGVKCFYLCDMSHGPGEIMKAAINAKISEEATSAGIRVCVWGQDPRKIFSEVGRAVGRSHLSKLYIDNKLVVPGHAPAPNPGQRPERTRKMIRASLVEPLKVLSLDSEGHLIIPTADEISRSCPVGLNTEQLEFFAQWRKEFPRPKKTEQPQPTATNPNPAVGGDPSGGGDDAAATVAKVGSQATADELSTVFKHEIIKEVDLPAGGVAAATHIKLCLTAAVGAVSTKLVWFHNSHAKSVSVPAGTFLGRGGPGSFVCLVKQKVADEKLPFCWRFTRLTGFKKDNAELSNGHMIFNKAGNPLPLAKQKLMCLSDIEAEIGNNVTVYGHAITRGGTKVTITPSPSPVVWVPHAPAVGGEGGAAAPDFSADTLGAFLPSHDDTSGVPKYTGLVRGVFETRVKAGGGPNPGESAGSSSGAKYHIEPGAPPGQSPLWILLLKKVEVPANGFVCVGSTVVG